jgi:hypothetical protein
VLDEVFLLTTTVSPTPYPRIDCADARVNFLSPWATADTTVDVTASLAVTVYVLIVKPPVSDGALKATKAEE